VVKSVALGALADLFEIDVHEDSHTAKGDALTCLEVYRRLVSLEVG
jgi:DNA polymerase III epsilon subunit-like protein